MAARNDTSAAKARRVEHQAHALELRRAGLGYSAIGQKLHISRSMAHKLVKQGLEDAEAQIDQSARELKAEELSRLSAMQAGLWPQAIKGSGPAVDRVLKIMERRAKLLGLDAPIRTALQGGGEDAPPVSTVSSSTVTFYMPHNGRD